MKFKKIKKRKIYETWQHKNRKLGLVTYIHFTPVSQINPKSYYHFFVTCFTKRCGLNKCNKNSCNQYVWYNSLEHNVIFDSFDECQKALIEWYKKYK